MKNNVNNSLMNTSTITKAQKNRDPGIDLVKGLCILFVFIGHSGIRLGNYKILWTSFYISSFFILSGFLFKYKENIKATIIHKIKSLLLLYLIWSVIPYCIVSIYDLYILKSLPADFLKNFVIIITGTNQPQYLGQLWFIYALFTVELLWILIDSRITKKSYKYIFILILTIIGLILNALKIKISIFRIGTAIVMLPIFLFGVVINKNKSKKLVKAMLNTNNYILIIATIIYLVLVYINGKITKFSFSIWNESFGFYPLFYINAILGTLLSYNILTRLNNIKIFPIKQICSFIQYFGTNSTTSLITMNIVINLVYYNICKLDITPVYIPYIVCAISVLLQIPIASILNFKKLRFLKCSYNK